MLPNNSLGSLIVQNQTLGGLLKTLGSCKLSAIGASVEHKGRISGGLAPFGAEESDDANRGNLTAVIQCQFNGYSAEEIVKEHTVTDVSPSRLEERGRGFRLGRAELSAGDNAGVKDSLAWRSRAAAGGALIAVLAYFRQSPLDWRQIVAAG